VTRLTFDVEDYSPPLLTPSESRSYYGRGLSGWSSDASAWVQRATFVEAAPRTMRCVALGGFPLPEMRLFVGAADVTRRFVLSHSVTLSGVRGLRSIRYRTERTADDMAFTSRDDGQPIKCVVTVPGLPANHTAVKIDVLCMYTLFLFSIIKVKGKGRHSSSWEPYPRATGRHLPLKLRPNGAIQMYYYYYYYYYTGITQCYLPPDTSERAPPNLSHAGWYSIYLPRRDGRLS